jgi:hypothetical protein
MNTCLRVLTTFVTHGEDKAEANEPEERATATDADAQQAGQDAPSRLPGLRLTFLRSPCCPCQLHVMYTAESAHATGHPRGTPAFVAVQSHRQPAQGGAPGHRKADDAASDDGQRLA